MSEVTLSKSCTICNTSQSLSAFVPWKRGKHGTTAACRTCTRERRQKAPDILHLFPDEEFRPIPQLGGRYSVSNYGRICRNTSGPNTAPNRIRRLALGSHGYVVASFHTPQGTTNYLVHRLVAQAFLGAPPEDGFVNHMDSDRRNNHISNLEYVSRAENMAHAARKGRLAKKITPDQVRAIRRDPRVNRLVGADYGIHHSMVSLIKRRKWWAHVPD